MIAADGKAKKSGKEADAKESRRFGRSSWKRNCKPIATAANATRTTSASASSWAAATSSTATSREAIKELQVAKADPRKRGVCMLYLGDCFYAIKQYPLAMSHYEQAMQDIPDRDQDNKKRRISRPASLPWG